MWAVMFEIEKGEFVYDTGKTVFTNYDSPLMFTDKEVAKKRATQWNTGTVVPYIRPMTDEERQESRIRGKPS
jgi:hypothetical protein|tara:strand:+ start:24 stop:239 length:216 start_codon:yes stop_codon:yes gene_type:complete